MTFLNQYTQLLLRLEALISEQPNRLLRNTNHSTCRSAILGAPLYNEAGKVFNPASGKDPFDPQNPYTYYNPNDRDSRTLKKFGLNDSIVCYRGSQPKMNYRANTEESIRSWNEDQNNPTEMETRDMMFPVGETFDESKLYHLKPLPSATFVLSSDEEDETQDPETMEKLQWDSLNELLPIMKIISEEKYGEKYPTTLVNINAYDSTNMINWPRTTFYYIHLNDKKIDTCSNDTMKYIPNHAYIKLCMINQYNAEINLATCEFEGSMARFLFRMDDRMGYYILGCRIRKKTSQSGSLSLGGVRIHFNSIRKLKNMIKELIM